IRKGCPDLKAEAGNGSNDPNPLTLRQSRRSETPSGTRSSRASTAERMSAERVESSFAVFLTASAIVYTARWNRAWFAGFAASLASQSTTWARTGGTVTTSPEPDRLAGSARGAAVLGGSDLGFNTASEGVDTCACPEEESLKVRTGSLSSFADFLGPAANTLLGTSGWLATSVEGGSSRVAMAWRWACSTASARLSAASRSGVGTGATGPDIDSVPDPFSGTGATTVPDPFSGTGSNRGISGCAAAGDDSGAVPSASLWNGERRQPAETAMRATQASTMAVCRASRPRDIEQPSDSKAEILQPLVPDDTGPTT